MVDYHDHVTNTAPRIMQGRGQVYTGMPSNFFKHIIMRRDNENDDESRIVRPIDLGASPKGDHYVLERG